MILKKIVLKNFRQFRGSQEIEFAGNGDSNVTVIFGENGRGKTGIFRALMFCLWGERRLSQDAQVDDRELYLVNYPEMQANADQKKPVESYVITEFLHEGQKVQIKRSILGLLENGEVIQEDKGVRLVTQDDAGNSITTRNPNEIVQVVGGIMDKGLREYFLFDGEKIERLTRASAEQRREVSAGVRKLLDIDTLETAIKATKSLKKHFDLELENRATGEYGQVIQRLRENEEKTSELERRASVIDEELRHAEQEKKHVDAELEKINEIRDLLLYRTNLEDKIQDLESELKGYLQEMKKRSGKTALLLVKETAEKVFANVDKRKQKHEIPSEIRRDLIDRLIADGRCICGTCLEPNSEEYRKILAWRNRTTDTITEDSMLNLWRYLSGVRSHYEDIWVATEALLQKYALKKNDLQLAIRELEELKERLGTSERADAVKLEKHRQKIERKIFQLEEEYEQIKRDLVELNEEKDQLTHQRKEIERDQGIRDEMAKRADLASATHDALKNIHEEFAGETRDLIGTTATEYFRELLDEEGKKTLREIVVDSDYSIQVYDHWQKPFLANISAGQRQIMSIAFIAALARTAAGKDILEMPLFMDTPFGRLSHEHRRNLLENVPKWCAQWVLLATDTEFGRLEARILRDTKKWNKFYILKGTGGPGSTIIEPIPVNQAENLLINEARGN